MSVPSESHEDIRKKEKSYSLKYGGHIWALSFEIYFASRAANKTPFCQEIQAVQEAGQFQATFTYFVRFFAHLFKLDGNNDERAIVLLF